MARPTRYRDEYEGQAYHLALLGATDADLARAFDVDISTVERWKTRHPAFRGALKKGKDSADGMVAKSLFRRALGYSHKAVKIVADAKTGAEHIVEYVERYPPDTVACIFWLKNRRPDLWRDKQLDDRATDDIAAIVTAIRAAEQAMDKADGLTSDA